MLNAEDVLDFVYTDSMHAYQLHANGYFESIVNNVTLKYNLYVTREGWR